MPENLGRYLRHFKPANRFSPFLIIWINNQLRGFEHIRGVILESFPLDTERDLVTATLKKKRNKLGSHYQVNKGITSFLFCLHPV
ncbi:hypothetical protein NC652_033236 [Populus alba x Populus x berolinensis]|nr:hypothetical protein NC652_033184 [Populus alba x Populus x berolinensis]KAJ6879845.1 hypothetical protein NC652_033236 [Populus alba x Populus x berolinensis]